MYEPRNYSINLLYGYGTYEKIKTVSFTFFVSISCMGMEYTEISEMQKTLEVSISYMGMELKLEVLPMGKEKSQSPIWLWNLMNILNLDTTYCINLLYGYGTMKTTAEMKIEICINLLYGYGSKFNFLMIAQKAYQSPVWV